MARRSFQVIDITEILVHWYAGRSQYELTDSLGVDRKTIRKYLVPAVEAGFVPPGPPVMAAEDWAVLVREWFPALVDTGLRQTTWPEIDRHRDYIVGQLAVGVTKATIHQRLADWTVPALVDTATSCPIRREPQGWVRHAADLPRSTRPRR